jgi:hypothetical protein
VLLVKRFKRLPPGSNRHWGHVVDARTGPGLKSMTKFKKRKEEQEGTAVVKETYSSKIFKKSKKKTFKKETSSLGGSSDDSPPSPTESQHSDFDDDRIFEKKFFSYSTRAQQQKNLKRQEAALKTKRKRKNPNPIKVSRWPANHFNLFSDVISDDLWSQKITCCGAIYECKDTAAVIINVSSFKPCQHHTSKNSASSSSSSPSPTPVQPQSLKASEMPSVPPPQQHTTTAIKKHHLFLKRNSDPSVAKSCDLSSSNVTEFSNIKDKTELMDTEEVERKDNMQSIDIKFKISDDKKGESCETFSSLR